MAENIISQNIKKIIEEKGFKQKSVAQKGGYTPQQFNNMLTGRKIIGGLDVLRISNALDVTPNDLFAQQSTEGR